MPYFSIMPFLLTRLYRFRREVVLLWRALFHAATPLHLKLLTVATALYLVSPIDLLPEFIPFAGLIDDVVLIPFAVNWIARRVPAEVVRDTGR